MGAVEALADVVERLHRERAELAAATRRARAFGAGNAFEAVIAQRVAHCAALANAR
jgi:hypothetical protein